VEVEAYNKKIQNSVPGEVCTIKAIDICTGDVSNVIKNEFMERLASKNLNGTYRLLSTLSLKTGVQYMMRVSINIVGGLVNGVVGCLCRVDTTEHSWLHTVPVRL
jgi:formaldehyde-activating enzyme involved in methanogenesis